MLVGAILNRGGRLQARVSMPNVGVLQTKQVAPSLSPQTVTPDAGYAGLSSVLVDAIPSNYGLITYDGFSITVS